MPREIEYYLSADSAPRGYADRRPWWVPPAFLVSIAAASAALATGLSVLTRGYADLIGAVSGLPQRNLLRHEASVSLRPVLLAIIVIYILFSSGSVRDRLRVGLRSGVLYLGTCILVDTVLAANVGLHMPSPLTHRGTVISVGAAVIVVAVVVLTAYELPHDVVVIQERKRALTPIRVFLLVLLIAVGVTAATWTERRMVIRDSHVPLIAGLAATLVVLVYTLQVGLYIAARLRRKTPPRLTQPLSVSVIIPAFNEEYSIGAVLEALSASAARYRGRVDVTVVDNLSGDRTGDRARETLAHCPALGGRVINCPTPGKSYALNAGLAATTGDIVIRVDADTIVEPTLFERVVPYFYDPTVGGVSGLPLPRPDAPRILYAIRYLEVLYSVGFLRVAQGGADATLVMPGNMSAYRGDIARRLGFGVGFNGEDTDMAVRVGRAGYQVLTDLDIRFFPEVPATVGQLREQRQRWSRGILHVAGRNISSIRMLQGVRAVWSLPWAVAGACRRAFTLPVFTGAGALAAVNPSTVTLREVALFGGIVMGMHIVVLIVISVRHRMWRLLPYLPLYLAFRLFKLYVALEAVLSLRVSQQARKAEESARMSVVSLVPDPDTPPV
jgi:Glycosyltransferase like family 2